MHIRSIYALIYLSGYNTTTALGAVTHRTSTCSSLNNLQALDEVSNFSILRGDISNAKAVRKRLAQHNVDVIVHFAARSHVDLSFDTANTFCESNITGIGTLLEAAGEHGSKQFLCSISSPFSDFSNILVRKEPKYCPEGSV